MTIVTLPGDKFRMSNRSEDGQDGYGTGITRVSKACRWKSGVTYYS